MYTRTLYNIYKKALMTLCFVVAVSCTDELGTDQTGTENPQNQDKGIGELVLFSAGNTGNATTRATVIPYMELDGRFVCKMYYHAKATDTDASPFDTETTPITSWLRVNDNEGNSVYWKNNFDIEGVDKNHQDYLDYGFDSRAQYFYWRNRMDHVFLAYTDFNLLKSNTYQLSGNTDEEGIPIPVARSLFMYPEADGEKKTKTGEIATWPPSGYSYKKLSFISSQDPENNSLQFGGVVSIPSHPGDLGVHFPLSGEYASSIDNYEAIRTKTKEKVIALITASTAMSAEEKTALLADINRESPYSENETTVEGVFRNDRWWITYDPDADGLIATDNAVNLEKAIVYQVREKQKIEEVFSTQPANTFDLTRGDKTSMAQQPDPMIALTKMKPTGATQEANRVRLYFKHQFSQIQVNLTNAENTAEIKSENILSVELLGVSQKGYVFTNINADGTQIAPTYEPVVISKYTEEQLKKNQYGTSFNMFIMGDEEKPSTALRSFNAIAFGQLQAIRITWQEEATHEIYTAETAVEANNKHLVKDVNGKMPGEDSYQTTYEAGYTPVSEGEDVPPVKHVATYQITVDDRGNSLVNLKSGFRYMYDFELRRGTIAFIRATIVGWQTDDELEYGTSGTINE